MKKIRLVRLFFCFPFAASTCIDIIPNGLHVNVNEPIHLVCRIRSTDAFNEQNIRVEWTRNEHPLINLAECLSNFSSADGILYETLIIRKARRMDTGIYKCRYGPLLTATSHIVVHQCELERRRNERKSPTIGFSFLDPPGSKSRRLISQLSGNSSLSQGSSRTVIRFFSLQTLLILFVLFNLNIVV